MILTLTFVIVAHFFPRVFSGMYCPINASYPVVCPSGSYCGAGVTHPTACTTTAPFSYLASSSSTACQGYTVTLYAGGVSGTTGTFVDGQGSNAGFSNPGEVAVDVDGNVYVADQSNNRIRKVTPAGGTQVLGVKLNI